MDTMMKTVEISIPEMDITLLQQLAKKFGWTVRKKKSGIDKSLGDIKAGRVYKAKDTEDLFKQILGK